MCCIGWKTWSRPMRDYREGLDFDPDVCEEIEERFLLLRNLQRKYGGTVAEDADAEPRKPPSNCIA